MLAEIATSVAAGNEFFESGSSPEQKKPTLRLFVILPANSKIAPLVPDWPRT